MPLQSVVSFGSIDCTIPVSGSTDAYNYFALSTPDSGSSQVYDRWRYLGHDGVQLKRMGMGGRAGTIIGWIDADSVGNLNTAELAIIQKVTDAIPETFTFAGGGGPTVNAVLTSYSFPRLWQHDGRICRDFVLSWEEAV